MNKDPFALKPVVWIATSREDLRRLPERVQKEIGIALLQVQRGLKPPSAKPLTGFQGAGVLEIREDYDGDTYRAVYTVRFTERIYVLHVFQKKSRSGIQTDKRDIELVQSRLKRAAARDAELRSEEQGGGQNGSRR